MTVLHLAVIVLAAWAAVATSFAYQFFIRLTFFEDKIQAALSYLDSEVEDVFTE